MLLAAAAAWLVLTRPVHRIEGDFLEREDRQVADDWLFEQLRNPVAELRARAFTALARIRGCAASEALADAMRDPAPSVRAQAALATGNAFDTRSGHEHGREHGRSHVLAAGGTSDARSGACTSPDAVAAALIALLSDEDRLVVTRAVEALGKMGWRRAAADITRTAAPIATAMTALMRMDADGQAAFVAEYLDSDDQDSRWAAALAAHHLRLAATPAVWERLQPLATDANEFVRAAALRALAAGQPGASVLALVSKNLEHRDPKVRFEARLAARALQGAPAPESLPAGEPALQLPAQGRPAGPLLEAGDYQRVAKTLGARVRMSTSLGDFDIELDYDQAPLTADHFRSLAAQGAFDGTAFAAVRSNGYAVADIALAPIRSELNAKPFQRGSVGLLRLGDASGGGLFICLTALPLADGRYVNFGRLVSGDQRLDRVAQGTAIMRVRESQ